MVSRPYDVVVYGATGFTGKLICEYLGRKLAAEREHFAFAIAGRNHAALAAVADRCGNPPIIIADATDPSSLRNMAAQARAVVSSVGPFTLYGEPLVEACIASSTHYCDTTGEVNFVLRLLKRHHEAAARRGIKLVPCCGMDCIPVDLGTLVCAEALPVPAQSVHAWATEINMLPSGGTMASAAAAMQAGAAEGINSAVYLLAPDADEALKVDTAVSPKARRGVGWDAALGSVTLPWLMASVDNRIVRRSLVLRQQATHYDESLSSGALVRLGSFALRHISSVLPYLSRSTRPKSGEGPSAAIQRNGSLVMLLEATGAHGERARVRVSVAGDPGYLCTAIMAAESVLCLAMDGDSPLLPRLPTSEVAATPAVAGGGTAQGDDSSSSSSSSSSGTVAQHGAAATAAYEVARGGLLTPATACGRALVQRLEASGRFEFTRVALSMPRKL